MRLGSLLLGVAPVLVGQGPPPKAPPALPWEGAALPPWQAEGESPWGDPPPPPGVEARGDLRLSLGRDGSLRVVDRRGTIRLGLGLPGRPSRVWRDGGTPLPPTGAWMFPSRTPLGERRGDLLFTAQDPRVGLEGLVWVLDDGERRLTVVHPATGKALFLRLPEGEAFDLAFFPDRLELREGVDPGPRQARRRWSLSWAVLVAQLARLAPGPEPPRGTALNPFPRD